MDLSQAGEYNLLKRLQRAIPLSPKEVLLGIGDDCAAVKVSGKEVLLISSDTLAEHIHFERETIGPYRLGYKSIAVNMSDIAAMGGMPRFVLINLCCPPHLPVSFIDSMYEGMNSICARYNTSIIGGDTVSSRKDLIISVSIIGYTKEEKIITRNGAKPGDKIYITGTAGDSSAGLDILKKYSEKNLSDFIKSRHRMAKPANFKERLALKHCMPTPRVDECQILINKIPVSSMIDLSDGLAAGIEEICVKSKKGAKIYLPHIPISEELKETAKILPKDMMEYALYGGEDYELLFTSSKKHINEEYFKCRITKIGEITGIDEGILLTDGEKKYYTNGKRGYEHFR